MTVSQWSVLVALYHGIDPSPTSVADYIGIDAGAVTRLADRLEGKGLVVRQRDMADRRVVLLLLTNAGWELVPSLSREADLNNDAFFSTISAGEHQAFRSMLVRLLEAAETPGVSSAK